MDKIALQCDVCGGPLTMQSGGQTAACEYCGTRYALERLREKVQEIRGKVTVEGVVKTSSADFEIHAGVLVKYHGEDTKIVVPQGVIKEIGTGCFSGCQYITSVVLPDGLQKISYGAFSGCSSLKKVNIPDSVTEIGYVDGFTQSGAFHGCMKLNNVIISSVNFKKLCPPIRENQCSAWNGNPAYSTYSWCWCSFWGGSVSSSISPYYIIDNDDKLENSSPWFRKILQQKISIIEKMGRPQNWKLSGLCQHCGGKFKGVFTKTCEECGRVKDY